MRWLGKGLIAWAAMSAAAVASPLNDVSISAFGDRGLLPSTSISSTLMSSQALSSTSRTSNMVRSARLAGAIESLGFGVKPFVSGNVSYSGHGPASSAGRASSTGRGRDLIVFAPEVISRWRGVPTSALAYLNASEPTQSPEASGLPDLDLAVNDSGEGLKGNVDYREVADSEKAKRAWRGLAAQFGTWGRGGGGPGLRGPGRVGVTPLQLGGGLAVIGSGGPTPPPIFSGLTPSTSAPTGATVSPVTISNVQLTSMPIPAAGYLFISALVAGAALRRRAR